MEFSEPELVIPALEILNLFDEGLATTELMTLIRQDLERDRPVNALYRGGGFAGYAADAA